MDRAIPLDLFHCTADLITEDAVITFVKNAMADRVQAESLVLELKRQNDGNNVIHAVAAMANTDGGMVLVGVDEKKDDPFVGINARQIDSIVQQMRALIPTAMPEVVPVALSAHVGQAILVLRVPEGAAERPIVVNGKVSVRAPGQTIGARRSEIISMVNENPSGQTSPTAYLAMTVGNCTMWPSEPETEVRVHAWLSLPRHLAGLSFLGSDAIAAVREVLQTSAVPRALVTDHHQTQDLTPSAWDYADTRALQAEFHAESHVTRFPNRPAFEASARLAVSGRILELMLSTSITQPNHPEQAVELTVPLLREALLGGVSAANAALIECARVIDPSAPIGPVRVDAWVGGSSGLTTLTLAPQWTVTVKRGPSSSGTWLFDPLSPDARILESCDEAVRHWLTLLLYGRGALEFEDDLAALPRPCWWDEIAEGLAQVGHPTSRHSA